MPNSQRRVLETNASEALPGNLSGLPDAPTEEALTRSDINELEEGEVCDVGFGFGYCFFPVSFAGEVTSGKDCGRRKAEG